MLDHPSLIKVIDQAQTDTEFVIVFEHCKLGTIKEHMYMNSGYSHKEIAEQLNISVSTSKTQLFKAKRALRKKI